LLELLTFDTEPVLALFLNETGARFVAGLLEKTQKNDIEGYISIVNLTEVYYAIARRDHKAADEKIKRLWQFGLKVVPIDEDSDLWREAALIKNRYLLSLGDAFAIATAKATKSKLVVGSDKQLDNLDIPLIRIR
jgi:PIN domain nuclease of toxin-antitoxin system